MASLALVSMACATPVVTSQDTGLPRTGWAVLGLRNHSETPQADERVRAMLVTLLRARGLESLAEAPSPTLDPVPELDQARRTAASIAWAREAGATLAVTGSVNEWRYSGTAESWPAVGITLTVVEVDSGRVRWSASGAMAGGPGDAASGTAQRLLGRLLDALEFK